MRDPLILTHNDDRAHGAVRRKGVSVQVAVGVRPGWAARDLVTARRVLVSALPRR